MTARVRPRSLSRWLQTAEDDAVRTCTGQHAATVDKIYGCIILNIVMHVCQSHSTKSNCWTNGPLFTVAGKWVQMDYCILPYKQSVGLLFKKIGISHIKLASSSTSFNIETKETATFPKQGKDGCFASELGKLRYRTATTKGSQQGISEPKLWSDRSHPKTEWRSFCSLRK